MNRAMLNKVPTVTVFFWLIKILSTTVGETVADFLNANLGLGLSKTTILCAAVLIALLIIQMRGSAYQPIIYWPTVVLVSITGTLLTDNLTDNLGISLYASSAVFAVLLAAAFIIWRKQEGTLSIHAINSRSREAFYWLAILVTFALGTAVGDLITEELGLGYRNGLVVFAGLVGLTALAYRQGAGAVLTFWTAYILTRPLGACLGDLLTAPQATSEDSPFPGLGLSRYAVNGVFLALIIGLVSYLAKSKVDQDSGAFANR